MPLGKRNPGQAEFLAGQVEVFLVRPVTDDAGEWEALVRPGRKMHVGERLHFVDGLTAEIVGRGGRGLRIVRFAVAGDALWERLEQLGHVPLPPYIRRPDTAADRERYQTVYARERGSVAAPTAGLHFTPAVLERCQAAGAALAQVTLHVGLGTFQPLADEEYVEANQLHHERYTVPAAGAATLQEATRRVAVGTTSVRVLETAARRGGLAAQQGETDLFLYPGQPFLATGAMVTNLHLPRSSLLLLVCAFGGTELVLEAYRHAVREGYRFFSYGDCMLLV